MFRWGEAQRERRSKRCFPENSTQLWELSYASFNVAVMGCCATGLSVANGRCIGNAIQARESNFSGQKKRRIETRVKKKRNLPTLEQCGHKCALFSFPRHTRQLNNSDRFCSWCAISYIQHLASTLLTKCLSHQLTLFPLSFFLSFFPLISNTCGICSIQMMTSTSRRLYLLSSFFFLPL